MNVHFAHFMSTLNAHPLFASRAAQCAAALGALAAALALLAALPAHTAAGTALAWALIGAPLTEEIVFRTGVHEGLLRHAAARAVPWPPLVANAATALLFTAAHVGARAGHGVDVATLATLLPALAIGVVYQRTRRALPCVALHAACNAAGALLLPAFT